MLLSLVAGLESNTDLGNNRLIVNGGYWNDNNGYVFGMAPALTKDLIIALKDSMAF